MYSVDAIIRYVAEGYSNEYYNIVNYSIDNETEVQNITLYDLNSTDATQFQLTFTGDDYLPVENALVFVGRQYISEKGGRLFLKAFSSRTDIPWGSTDILS